MAGLFSGIIGSLIGAGIQAIYGGIPIREDASQALEVLRRSGLPVPPENWFSKKSPTGQRTEHGYGAIEQHVAGAIQILGPCMHIAKTITSAARPESQSAAAGAWTPQEEPARSETGYKSARNNDPMLSSPGTLENKECGCECSRSRKATLSTRYVNLNKNNYPSESIERDDNTNPNKTAEKLGSSSSSNFGCNGQESKNVRPTGSIKIEPNSRIKIEPNSRIKIEPNSRIKIEPNSFNENEQLGATVNRKIDKNDPQKWDTEVDKFTITAENKRDLKRNPSGRSSTVAAKSQKLIKPQNKVEKSAHDLDKCQSCEAKIRNIKKAPLMPCGHVVCYKCLQSMGKKPLRCPKCGLKFN